MNKRIKMAISAVMLFAIVLVLGACGSKTESGVYTGTLAEALDNKIAVNTDSGIKEFKTDDSTVYDLGGFEHMSIDDVVDVNYHSSLGKKKRIMKLKNQLQSAVSFQSLPRSR